MRRAVSNVPDRAAQSGHRAGAALQNQGRKDLFFTYVPVAIGISLLVCIFALKNKKATHLDAEQGSAFGEAGGCAADGGGKDRSGDLSRV